MEEETLYYEQHEKYCYLEVPQTVILESALLKKMTDYIQDAAKENKKSLVCLAPNFQISDEDFQTFFDFIEKNLLDYVFFVSKEGIRWGEHWKKLTKRPFWIANKHSMKILIFNHPHKCGLMEAVAIERDKLIIDITFNLECQFR